MGTGNRSTVIAPDDDVVLRPIGRNGPRSFQKMNATLGEVGLEDGRHLGIFLGKNLLAADDERDLTTQRREQVHELHTGDARPDDHDVVGQDLGRISVSG